MGMFPFICSELFFIRVGITVLQASGRMEKDTVWEWNNEDVGYTRASGPRV
jgi:hypothetical protein